MARERRDNKGRLLLTGEAQIRNGSYTFRYTDENGVRKSITNWKLLPEDQPAFRPNSRVIACNVVGIFFN